ncbi:MAG TPA: SdrD B-like domain-containing protein, partial [Ilumatobacter sp.]|nr:SdrD B-like domain-containing protein [Ilumatobacter sp.]
MRKPRSFSAARVLLVGALVAGLVALIPLGPGGVSPAAAAPGDGTITVRVVQEVNANGLVDSTIMEPPLAGVTVHVSDGEGNSISSVTDDAGLAVFDLSATALVGGNYRVEADNPRPDFFYPSHAANGQSGPAAKITPANLQSPSNAKLSSTVEFVDVDDETDAYVNMAFWYPPYYCQENPTLCSAVQPWSATPPGGVSPPTEQTLISVPYRFNVGDQDLATNADTGVVYGIAYDRANQRIFSAAYAKRGSAYGPGGPGAIYVTDLSTTTFPLAGTTSQFATVPNPGSTARDMATNHDHAFFDRPGKESLGDIDITNDNRYLFGVNMFDKTVFVFDLADDSYVGSYAIPNPGCGDDWRPMGTGVGLDVSYVGGVCSGQTNQDMDEMTAHVYTFDPADGTFGAQVLDQPLTYSKGQAYDGGNCNGGIEGSAIGRWFSWVSRFPSVPNEQRAAGCSTGWMAYPTPMLGDIIEETNGDLVISFRDRFTDQAGWNALEETATGTFSTLYQPAAGGDIVRGCKLSDGTFVLDPNLDAGDVLAPSALCTNNNDGSTNNGGQSTTFREFYTGDWRTGFHEEAFYGGIALARSEVNLTGTGYDMNGAVWTQGIGAINRNGSLTSGNLGVQTDDSTVGLFGKGTGMADLEVLCDEAPIQVGNRVWMDTDGDGIQDPGEIPIVGVTVRLYDELGNLVGTTTTSANGEYYFDQTNVTGGLSQDTTYVVRLDLPTDYEAGGPLYSTQPTLANVGANDELDSDGVVVDGYPQATLTTGGAGVDDHTWDFGFTLPSVSVGDFVWVDTSRDGIQDPGEPGIPGVVLILTDADGQPVTDVYGNLVGPVTTDADGLYDFPGLPVGAAYTVTIDEAASAAALAPYIPTIPGAGDPDEDSSTGSATSVVLPNDGDRDPTLDFGFVLPAVSVGDYVWVDTDRDGIQDPGEPGIPGVTLTLTGPDGEPVTDVFGNPVEPAVT